MAVVRLLLCIKWSEIHAEWKEKPNHPKYCVQNANADAVCPTDEQWWARCRCQLSTAMHKVRPSNESTIFLVPKSNTPKWENELTTNVKLKKLEIRLAVAHESLTNLALTYASDLTGLIKMKRDASLDPPLIHRKKRDGCTSIELLLTIWMLQLD